nr:hypothetical protein [Tanacetum cinerariifolium]
MEVEIPYELLKDDQKKQLGKKNEANMTLHNALLVTPSFMGLTGSASGLLVFGGGLVNNFGSGLLLKVSSGSGQKCVFNANHDDCITKFLKEVNSRAKVQSLKFRDNIKPAKRIPNVKKPERWISKGYRFSPNKSFVVHEKPNTLRSCLRWKPTGRIFKIAGLRWTPTGKMFIDSITKVDSEPLNGLNDDITNSYECDQTLNVSAGLVQNSVSPTPYVLPSKKDYEILFQPLFDKYFNPPPCAVSPNMTAVTAPRAVDPAGSPLSTTIDQDVPSAITSPTTQ